MRYVVYTEVLQEHGVERWYYGVYRDEDRANEIALDLGHDRENGIYHCVCDECDAKALHIKNLPW